MIHFSGCALNEACTIVLRGASERGSRLQVACVPGRHVVLVQVLPFSRVTPSAGPHLTSQPAPMTDRCWYPGQATTCWTKRSGRCTMRCAC